MKTREQRKNAKDARRVRGLFIHENDKNKGLSHVQDEMEKLVHHDEQELLSVCGKDGTGMTTEAGGLIRTCAPRHDVRRWSTFVTTKCTQGLQRNLLT